MSLNEIINHSRLINVNNLNENSRKYNINPDKFKIKLHPHQLTLLQACINFENNKIYLKKYKNLVDNYNVGENDYIRTNMAVIGDKVGSGKSYVILALILENKCIHNSQIESYGLNNIFINITSPLETYKTNLLVIPHNLYYQWKKYITNITDTNFKYKLICRKKDLQEFILDTKKLNDYDLILVTDTNFKIISNLILINNIKINRLIFDEIDSLNIPSNKKLNSNFYWFITASYSNLLFPKGYGFFDKRLNVYIRKASGLNNKGYITDLFTNIFYNMKEEFSHLLVLKNDDIYIDKSFNIPIPNQYIIQCKDPISTILLNGIVDKNVINCLNANNSKGAIELFNSRQKITEENIINIVIEKFIDQIKNLNIQIEAYRQMIFNTDIDLNIRERNSRIEKLEEKKNKLDTKINDIKKRINNNNLCSICYEDIEDKTLVKCCSNIFCFKCINLWLCQKACCPLCKNNLKEDELFLIQEKDNETKNEIIDTNEINKNFDKLQNLEILLKNKKEGSKYLIFSEYDISFDNIIKIFENKYKYSYLKGNKYIIQRILNDYKEGDLDILLVNIHNYGSGLNLENTTDIVMFHKFDANIENQVIGRAQRFGRKESLNIHYLLNQNEISQI
tara:strand:- start:19592 stop:21457 length:1866 start_codon:yes stop_codon:yes gene_type:complete